jgi:Uma2 family endonuclease
MTSATALEPEIAAAATGDDAFYEIVDDRRVELPPMGAFGGRIATILSARIENFGSEHGLGRAVTEVLFRLRANPSLQRRPDVAFVSFERWPKSRRLPQVNAWDVVPDLAVEVISPTNLAEEIPTRVREFFEAGVRLVWVIFPHESIVYAYESPWSIRVSRSTEELDGGAVIPGFRFLIADLFEGTEDAPPAANPG